MRAARSMIARGNGRMLVLCPYPVGVAAGQRLKFEQYYDDWRAHGWEVTVAPFMDRPLWNVVYERGHVLAKALGIVRGYLRRVRDLLSMRSHDLVYCFMYVSPLGTSAFERVTRRLARRLVFDVEDNVITQLNRSIDDHPNPLIRFVRGSGKARYLIRKADHVISSSPALNDQCKAINEAHAATYISSSVDAERFVPANRYINDGKVTIGWTGTFSSRPYLDLIAPVLQQLAKERDFRLRVIGNFDYALPGVDLEVVRWTAEVEIEDLQAIDIGLYPLPIDDWVSGKSGLKAIQYMMMGLPCVATDVGTTPLIIRHGENGLLVRTEAEWLDALRMLLDDPGLRRRLGQQARQDAVAKYSTKAIAAEYRKVLDQVMER
jgi:glycosyltransferase involved in cell wall biosynthesis